MRPTLLVAALTLLALACSDPAAGPAPARDAGAEPPAPAAAAPGDAAATVPARADAAPGVTKVQATPRRRRERPLPSWSGTTLSGEPVRLGELLGRRLVLFFFNPEVESAGAVADALGRVAPLAGEHNFEVVPVALDGSDEALRSFLDAHGLGGTRVLLDRRAALAGRVGLRSPVAVLVADAEGYLVAGTARVPEDDPDPAASVEQQLREWLRLPPSRVATIEMLGERPPAPGFQAERLEGGTFELASLRGRPAVLMFFLHTCPHCHHALEFFEAALAEIPEAKRPPLVGVSWMNRPASVRAMLAEKELDFFPVLMDPEGTIRQRYGATQSVPVVFLLDAEGRIVSRTEGWREDRDPALARMRLAKLTGERVPMLLHKTGYSGNDVCAVCHESQAASWELTTHATAFDTLVRHGANQDGECVSCHVVGWGEPGGWSFEHPEAPLEGVGCETCHGRGGPHLSPEFVQGHDYRAVCGDCHTPKHSLGFAYGEFLPKVSHAANRDLAALPIAEKRRILRERRQPRDVLRRDAAFVGSQACASCHPAEYETWKAQPHGRALASLEAEGEAGNAECLACHTTGYGERGGFPEGGAPDAHPDLAAVGCESCHGPGGDHVPAEAAKTGTIVSLGDKCDSCVILQICGSCHDDANDPGFEYEVEAKIEAQRHGTIEPGGAPKTDAQARRLSPGEDAPGHALEAVFRAHPPAERDRPGSTPREERG